MELINVSFLKRMKTLNRIKETCIILIFLIFSTESLMSEGLHEAKENKKICELPNGYVRANDPNYQVLVDQVNRQRRQEYESIAQKNGTSTEAAAKVTAETLAKQNPRHVC